MAEQVKKAELFKGIEYPVEAQMLEPDTEYYATLRDPDTGGYIATEKVRTDAEGTAMFVFPYEMTNELCDDASLSLFIFEADRGYMAFHADRVIRVIPTSLRDDKDVQKYQIKNRD